MMDNSLFATTVWWIWKWRNDVAFNNAEYPLKFKVNWILTQVEHANRAFSRANNHQRSNPIWSWRKLHWSKPQEGYAKVNVDGAVVQATNTAGCGGIIRDDTGLWKGGFICNIGSCSPLQAEA